MAGLYGGMSLHLLRAVPNTAITFLTYEAIMSLLNTYNFVQCVYICIYLHQEFTLLLLFLVNVLCRFYCDIINKGNAITNVICVFFYYHIRRHPLTRALNVLDTMCSRASGVSLDWTHLQIVCCLVAVFERCHCLFGWNANTFVVLQAHLRPVCFLQWMLGQHVL